MIFMTILISFQGQIGKSENSPSFSILLLSLTYQFVKKIVGVNLDDHKKMVLVFTRFHFQDCILD